MSRICIKCNKEIPQHLNRCKPCRDEYCKEYNKQYKEKNKEALKEYRFNYRNSNKELLKEQSDNYYSLNQEILKEKSKDFRKNNKEEVKEFKKIFYQKNKSKINLSVKLRRDNDPLFKLSSNLRSLIRKSLREKGYTKKSKTYKILGCSFKDFKDYIENQFEPWMDWNNHGIYTGDYSVTWQYDHIIPISEAKTEEELIKLNHYTNFQPLCSRKNLEKSNEIFNREEQLL